MLHLVKRLSANLIKNTLFGKYMETTDNLNTTKKVFSSGNLKSYLFKK